MRSAAVGGLEPRHPLVDPSLSRTQDIVSPEENFIIVFSRGSLSKVSLSPVERYNECTELYLALERVSRTLKMDLFTRHCSITVSIVYGWL